MCCDDDDVSVNVSGESEKYDGEGRVSRQQQSPAPPSRQFSLSRLKCKTDVQALAFMKL